MVFARIGLAVVALVFVLPLLTFSIAFFRAFGTDSIDENRRFAREFLRKETAGVAINEGATGLLIGLALGTLCEIALALRRRERAA